MYPILATTIEILCPVLPNITDGFVIIESRSIDSRAVYNCSAGFEIVGTDVRVCMENGSWDGAEPLCKGKQQCWVCKGQQ